VSNNHNSAPDDRPELTDWTAVNRLAANNDPDKLFDLALNACSALIAHHRVSIEGWKVKLGEVFASGCRCEKCSGTITACTELIAQACADRAQVAAAGDLLAALYQRTFHEPVISAARPDEIEKFLEGMAQDKAQEAGE
jgi:hypothetical protein